MRNLVADHGERRDEAAQLLGVQDRRLGTIGLHMRDRDPAQALWQRQRITARGENDALATQRQGGGENTRRRWCLCRQSANRRRGPMPTA